MNTQGLRRVRVRVRRDEGAGGEVRQAGLGADGKTYSNNNVQ